MKIVEAFECFRESVYIVCFYSILGIIALGFMLDSISPYVNRREFNPVVIYKPSLREDPQITFRNILNATEVLRGEFYSMLIDADYENAAAIYEENMIVFGQKLMGMLGSTDEVAWAIGHELGHHIIFKAGLFGKLTDQQNEFLADVIGKDLATKAGYDPCKGVNTILILYQLGKNGGVVWDHHSSHPHPLARLNNLKCGIEVKEVATDAE